MGEEPRKANRNLTWRHKRIPVTEDVIATIKLARARVGPRKMSPLLQVHQSCPPNLTPSVINHLLDGRHQTIRSDHLAFFELLTYTPDAQLRIMPDYDPARDAVTLIPELMAELHRLKDRTGIGPLRIMSMSRHPPDGLSGGIINNWLTGQTRIARSQHLGFVMEFWRNVTPMVEITPETAARLRAEMERTGYTPKSLANRLLPLPEGLSRVLISRWAHGRTKYAREDLLDLVLDELAGIPDAAK